MSAAPSQTRHEVSKSVVVGCGCGGRGETGIAASLPTPSSMQFAITLFSSPSVRAPGVPGFEPRMILTAALLADGSRGVRIDICGLV